MEVYLELEFGIQFGYMCSRSIKLWLKGSLLQDCHFVGYHHVHLDNDTITCHFEYCYGGMRSS